MSCERGGEVRDIRIGDAGIECVIPQLRLNVNRLRGVGGTHCGVVEIDVIPGTPGECGRALLSPDNSREAIGASRGAGTDFVDAGIAVLDERELEEIPARWIGEQ